MKVMLKPTKRVVNVLNRMVAHTTTPAGLARLNRDHIGICTLINGYMEADCRRLSAEALGDTRWVWREYMHQFFREWPEFSGNDSYPVPHRALGAQQAYYAMGLTGMFGHTPYGESRIRLLKFLADRFQTLYYTLKETPQ